MFAGVLQAMISHAIADEDDLRSIHAGGHMFCFRCVDHLYYVAAVRSGEPVSSVLQMLEMLHLQILSVLNKTTVDRIFGRRANYDLRNLLGGTGTVPLSLSPPPRLPLLLSVCLSQLTLRPAEPLCSAHHRLYSARPYMCRVQRRQLPPSINAVPGPAPGGPRWSRRSSSQGRPFLHTHLHSPSASPSVSV